MQLSRINISSGSLTSRIVRQSAGERGIGQRSPNLIQRTQGFFELISSAGKGLINSIIDKVKSFEWNFATLAQGLVEGLYALSYFDWNKSDEEIRAEIEQTNITISRNNGQLFGSEVFQSESFVPLGKSKIDQRCCINSKS